MFTSEERAALRAHLLSRATKDRRISGVAITGSAAAGREDQWSDIDLAFGVGDAAELPEVLSDWTEHMYSEHGVLHHVDVRFSTWIYRVFLLPNTLQVDLAFVPAVEFRALSPAFQLVSGESRESQHFTPPPVADIIGLAWLHALHARSCIARRQVWQAEYMISGVRDHTLALACIRHGLPAAHGRGMDQLPAGVSAQFEGALVRQLNPVELSRALRVAIDGLVTEIRNVDEVLAGRLSDALIELGKTSS
jgi:hypothetical protein